MDNDSLDYSKETLKQLREIQAECHNREKEQLNNAASIMEMHKDAGLPYDPTQDGFVFSPSEIETCIPEKRSAHPSPPGRFSLARPV